MRERFDASFQGVDKFFVLAYETGDNDTNNENWYKKYFLQIITLKLMVEIFMINHLMTQLSNMMKSEKYQQGKVMITLLAVY